VRDTLYICILTLALDKHTLILNWGKILYESPVTLRWLSDIFKCLDKYINKSIYIEYLCVLYYYFWIIKRNYKLIHFVKDNLLNKLRVRASFILITVHVGVISITITISARTVIISGSYLPPRVRSMNSHPTTGKSELPTNRILFLCFNIFLGIDFPYIKILWICRNKLMSYVTAKKR